MSTDTKIAVDRPTMTGPAPKPPRDKDMRIATMTKQLLGEVRPNIEPCSLTTRLPDDSAPNKDNPVIRSARRTLITAITKRITQQPLNAAQAAALLHLTGPRVTQLLQGNIDEFTLDELVNLLPFLQLTVHVVPAPEQNVRSSG
jgi:predicted XRE-type DNA-binding protein